MSDYFAESKARDAERAKAFVTKMEMVAADLSRIEGNYWSFNAGDHENTVRPYGTLISSDALALHVDQYRDGYSGNAKDRISVSGSWPREKHGPYRSLRDYGVIEYGAAEPKITVSADASVNRIAKDIKRRLLVAEDLRGKYAKVLEVIASREAYENGKNALALALFEAAGQAPTQRDLEPGRSPSLRLYDFVPGVSYGSIEVRGDDSVHIDVSVNGAVAKAFLEFLKARRLPGMARHAGAVS